jgi:hypothetical protein
MSRTRRWTLAGVLLILALACGGWAWFLAGRPLSERDQWSSVLGGFAGVVFGVLGLVVAVLALRQPPAVQPPDDAPAPEAPPSPRPGSGDRSVTVRGSNDGIIVTGDGNRIDRRHDG